MISVIFWWYWLALDRFEAMLKLNSTFLAFTIEFNFYYIMNFI